MALSQGLVASDGSMWLVVGGFWRKMPDSVENLQIWQESVDLVEQVYVATKAWPKEEIYGLPRGIRGCVHIPQGRRSQTRRAVVSIPANLAEGVGRGTRRETARFAQIALGSLYETDTLCVIAERLGYIDQDTLRRLRETVSGLCRRISSFISYQKEHHDSH